jgi:predicted RND superfamily exporter protein
VRISVVADATGSTEHHALRQRIEAAASELDLDLTITGRHDLYQTMIHYVVVSFVQSLGLAVVLVSLCMGAFLRSGRLALLAMVPNMVPLMVGGGLLYLLGKPMDIGTLGVGSVVLGIAVDDTVHILATFRRHVLDEGPVRAVAHVLSHTAPALITTTGMLVAAFGTLAFGVFVPNVWFGIMVAACLVVALVADLVALPALLLVAWPERSAAS